LIATVLENFSYLFCSVIVIYQKVAYRITINRNSIYFGREKKQQKKKIIQMYLSTLLKTFHPWLMIGIYVL